MIRALGSAKEEKTSSRHVLFSSCSVSTDQHLKSEYCVWLTLQSLGERPFLNAGTAETRAAVHFQLPRPIVQPPAGCATASSMTTLAPRCVQDAEQVHVVVVLGVLLSSCHKY